MRCSPARAHPMSVYGVTRGPRPGRKANARHRETPRGTHSAPSGPRRTCRRAGGPASISGWCSLSALAQCSDTGACVPPQFPETRPPTLPAVPRTVRRVRLLSIGARPGGCPDVWPAVRPARGIRAFGCRVQRPETSLWVDADPSPECRRFHNMVIVCLPFFWCVESSLSTPFSNK